MIIIPNKEQRHEAYKYALEQHFIEVQNNHESSPCIHIRDGFFKSYPIPQFSQTVKYFEEFALFIPEGQEGFSGNDSNDLDQVEIALLFIIEMTKP